MEPGLGAGGKSIGIERGIVGEWGLGESVAEQSIIYSKLQRLSAILHVMKHSDSMSGVSCSVDRISSTKYDCIVYRLYVWLK